jgi:hypothetical protein
VLLAGSPGASVSRPVQVVALASVDAPLAPPCVLNVVCTSPDGGGLFGAGVSAPIPNALAAAVVGTGQSAPLYGLIGLAGQIPVVDIFIRNGTNAAAGSGAAGGDAGLGMR